MWTARPSTKARPIAKPRSGGRGNSPTVLLRLLGQDVVDRDQVELAVVEAATKLSSASHNRSALFTMASKTGWTSAGELEMTRRSSPVAVC